MRIAIAILITLAALTGCGKKGALVLPDAPPVSASISAPTQTQTTTPAR